MSSTVDARAMEGTATGCGTVSELLRCGIEGFMAMEMRPHGFASWMKHVAKNGVADEFFVDLKSLWA